MSGPRNLNKNELTTAPSKPNEYPLQEIKVETSLNSAPPKADRADIFHLDALESLVHNPAFVTLNSTKMTCPPEIIIEEEPKITNETEGLNASQSNNEEKEKIQKSKEIDEKIDLKQNTLSVQAIETAARPISPVRTRQQNFFMEKVNSSPKLVIEIEPPKRSLFGMIKSPVTSPSLSRHKTPPSSGLFGSITERVTSYAELHQLLIDSSLQHTQDTTTYNNIPEDNMLDIEVVEAEEKDRNEDQALKDDQIFEIGFTRKDCMRLLPFHIPYLSDKICTDECMVKHASLAFRDPDTGKFLIIGRQNNQFLKKTPSDHPSFITWAATSLLAPSTIWNFTDTHMDNEKKFNFFPGSLFNAEMCGVLLSGAEIKKVINAVNEKICSKPYDLIHSNCYSAVLFGLTKVFEIILERGDDSQYRTQNNNDLKRIFTLISSAMQDNLKMGLGAANNSTVNEAIKKMAQALEKRGLLKINVDAIDSKQKQSNSSQDDGKDKTTDFRHHSYS